MMQPSMIGGPPQSAGSYAVESTAVDGLARSVKVFLPTAGSGERYVLNFETHYPTWFGLTVLASILAIVAGFVAPIAGVGAELGWLVPVGFFGVYWIGSRAARFDAEH